MKILVIDYGSGNLRSAAKSLEAAAKLTHKNVSVLVSDKASDLSDADKIVLPGQGAYGDCMRGLHGVDGLLEALNSAVFDRGVPFLGICVGMQLMAARGIEHGDHTGLGWFPGLVSGLDPVIKTLKIPHMGWNNLTMVRTHPVFEGLPRDAHVYFVHSFAYQPDQADEVIANVDYGGPVTAAIGNGNLLGVQFHPDKSQAIGLKILANFINWHP